MSLFDALVTGAYIVLSVAVGLYFGTRSSEVDARSGRWQGYWLGARNFGWLPIALTIMATVVSSNALVSHSGIASARGLVLLPGFFLLPFILIFAARVLVPFYRQAVQMSPYEYLAQRFGGVFQRYAGMGFVLDRTFDMAVTLVTSAIVLKVFAGTPLWVAMLVVMSCTLLYTAFGGIVAVVWSDVLQGGVLLLIALVVVVSVGAVSGDAFADAWFESWEKGLVTLGDWQLSKAIFVSSETSPWLVMCALSIIWLRKYWCDQTLVQRYLMASSDGAARQGLYLATFLIVFLVVVFNVLGVAMAGQFALTGIAPPLVRDEIFPHFVLQFLPAGLTGIVLAAVLAAAMSSISSDINGVAGVIMNDWLRSAASPSLKLVVAKAVALATGLLVMLVALWLSPDSVSQPLALRVVAIATALSGAVVGVFCLGFFTERTTAAGAFTGLLTGLLVSAWAVLTGGASPVLEITARYPLNPMLAGVVSQLTVIVIGYTFSFLSTHKPAAQVLTYWSWRRARNTH